MQVLFLYSKGTKHFFFGDRPSCVDCSVFGQLSQFLWHLPGSEPNAMLKSIRHKIILNWIWLLSTTIQWPPIKVQSSDWNIHIFLRGSNQCLALLEIIFNFQIFDMIVDSEIMLRYNAYLFHDATSLPDIVVTTNLFHDSAVFIWRNHKVKAEYCILRMAWLLI